MKLETFLAALRLYWITFLVVAAVVVVVGLSWAFLTPAKFVSTTQLMVSIEGSTTAAAYQNDQVVSGRVNSYVALLTSEVVTQRVIDELGLSQTADELAGNVSATIVPPRTALIDIAVTDESPAQARLLAVTLAREFIEYSTALETPTGADDQKVQTRVVTAASDPYEQFPEPWILGALAGIAGVVLGAVAVWIRSRTDPVVRTTAQAAAASGAPAIGCASSTPSAAGNDFEAYRRLRARLGSMIERPDDRAHVWVVTCAVGEVDTGVLAANLGHALGMGGSRVIVVDVDITDAEIAAETCPEENKQGPGREAIYRESSAAEKSIRRGANGQPDILFAGAGAADRADLLATTGMKVLIDRLRTEYAHVIIAATPVLSNCTASVVSEYADGVLLGLSLGTTRRRDLGRAAQNLRATGAVLTGTVLFVAESHRPVDQHGALNKTGKHAVGEFGSVGLT